MIYLSATRELVEEVLKQLRGYVPKGKCVQFNISYAPEDKVIFDAVQTFGEEDQPQSETAHEKQ